MKLITLILALFIVLPAFSDSFTIEKNGKTYYCEAEETNEPVTCVPRCTWRSADGTCLNYAQDFCGRNAYCEENCTWRGNEGECLNYGPDICSKD